MIALDLKPLIFVALLAIALSALAAVWLDRRLRDPLMLRANARPAELRAALEKAGIAADNGQRLAYIVMHAELDGLICSGARRGKQFTYALLEERAPHAECGDERSERRTVLILVVEE